MVLGEGSYFGDEEGNAEPVKNFYAKVTSVKVMLFYLSKDKIRMNAQEIASFLIDELNQKSVEKTAKVKDTLERMTQMRQEQEKQLAAFEFKRVQEKEREKTKSLHNREVEACNAALSFSKRMKTTTENKASLTLHSKLANRVEELVKFKTELAKKNMILHYGEDYDPKAEAENFIDFSFAQGGKNLPGRLTIEKQVEKANRHNHIAFKITEFKKQGLKYAVKKPLPDESKISYDTINNKVIKELQHDAKMRDKPQILMTESYRGWKNRIPPNSDRSHMYHDNQQTMTTRSLIDQRPTIDRSASYNRSYDQAFSSEIGREVRSFSRDASNKLSRIDRASRAISKKIKLIKNIASISPKDINVEGVHTAASSRINSWLQNSPTSRDKSLLLTTERTRSNHPTQYLTTESWLPKTKHT